ncbi:MULTISPECIES: hypothetical protein [Clostridium]|uniref:hypothetical protein n=1 Tax=Clostridium TaxID=1485 RepID=UPI000825E401|nr:MULTISPECIES: hypothetical protein [Clostridium]PJI09826.1 hypothetical protein CUB90_18985 [Clostridium sp. CT7]
MNNIDMDARVKIDDSIKTQKIHHNGKIQPLKREKKDKNNHNFNSKRQKSNDKKFVVVAYKDNKTAVKTIEVEAFKQDDGINHNDQKNDKGKFLDIRR